MGTQEIRPRKINKDHPTPYYHQIVESLREAIGNLDEPEVNERIALPSEPELGAFFFVNRGTIRHALQVLEREGLIYREKGKGTFVRRRRVEMDLSYLCSTTEDIKNRGWEPGTEVISVEKNIPRAHIREGLQLGDGEMVWEVFRCRSANSEPISLQRAFFPAALMPDLDRQDLSGSYYSIWAEVYHIYPRDGEQTIRMRTANAQEAALLGISADACIFEITRVTFDSNGIPFEYLISVWRGDRYDFYVRLSSR